jgi:5-methylcytosine-specific restriction enzyme A
LKQLLAMKTTLSKSNAFLFTWNPKNWPWLHLTESIQEIQRTGKTSQRWVCRSHKKVKIGDQAFLIRLGVEPKGICASGTVVSNSFEDVHYSDPTKVANYVMIEFDVILNPKEQPLLSFYQLRDELPDQIWAPESSGNPIKPEMVEELESRWLRFLDTNGLLPNLPTLNPQGTQGNDEGASYEVTLTKYERDKNNRDQCLRIKGYTCKGCGINFERTYGPIGREYIHVHHLTPISSMGVRKIDPVKDLVPVCPNCHAMLHKRNPPYTITELRGFLQENSDGGIVEA